MENPRFVRFVYEFELEVVDPTTTAAFSFDIGVDEAGNLGMVPFDNVADQLQVVLTQVLSETLRDRGPEFGIKWMGGPVLARYRCPEGWYPERTLGEMPGRADDGTLIYGPIWSDIVGKGQGPE